MYEVDRELHHAAEQLKLLQELDLRQGELQVTAPYRLFIGALILTRLCCRCPHGVMAH